MADTVAQTAAISKFITREAGAIPRDITTSGTPGAAGSKIVVTFAADDFDGNAAHQDKDIARIRGALRNFFGNRFDIIEILFTGSH